MARKFKRRVAGDEVSRETLLQTPHRAFALLIGISKEHTVRDLLATRGLDDAEANRGVALIQRLLFGRRPSHESDADVNAAIAELDQWDEFGYGLINASFRRHPEAHAAVLEGITPVAGIGAVLNVAAILERLDALEDTEDGRKALATLTKRGLDKAERKRLAALVSVARSKDRMKADEGRMKAEAEYEEALLDLRDWYVEWAEIARLVVKRRDHLISLGLAERRSPTPTDVDDGDDPDDVEDPTPFIDPNKPTS